MIDRSLGVHKDILSHLDNERASIACMAPDGRCISALCNSSIELIPGAPPLLWI